MFKSLLALCAFIAVPAMACPDLSGTYTCTYDGKSETVNVAVVEQNGQTYYQWNDGYIPADNQVYDFQDEQIHEGKFRGWCEAEVLKIEILGKYFYNNQYTGDLTINGDIYLDANKNLVQDTNGKLVTTDGSEYPFNEQTVCTRN